MGSFPPGQRAWSTLGPQNVHTIEGDISHMSLLDDTRVRQKLLELVQGAAPPDPELQVVAGEVRIAPASLEDFNTVTIALQQIVREEPKEEARTSVRAYIARLGFARQQALMKRGYMELLKGPIMPLDRAPDRECPPTPARAR